MPNVKFEYAERRRKKLKFFFFEGPECVGKTTQLNALISQLSGIKIAVKCPFGISTDELTYTNPLTEEQERCTLQKNYETNIKTIICNKDFWLNNGEKIGEKHLKRFERAAITNILVNAADREILFKELTKLVLGVKTIDPTDLKPLTKFIINPNFRFYDEKDLGYKLTKGNNVDYNIYKNMLFNSAETMYRNMYERITDTNVPVTILFDRGPISGQIYNKILPLEFLRRYSYNIEPDALDAESENLLAIAQLQNKVLIEEINYLNTIFFGSQNYDYNISENINNVMFKSSKKLGEFVKNADRKTDIYDTSEEITSIITNIYDKIFEESLYYDIKLANSPETFFDNSPCGNIRVSYLNKFIMLNMFMLHRFKSDPIRVDTDDYLNHDNESSIAKILITNDLARQMIAIITGHR